jgi:hypothetical protein
MTTQITTPDDNLDDNPEWQSQTTTHMTTPEANLNYPNPYDIEMTTPDDKPRWQTRWQPT